ncbi:MAG: hypothetical protein PHG25_00475 [Candidatus Pacebacteria bacterium]|nr:hypothetical protein [Candidatus Paceibacterota bacterium]
MNTPSHTSIDPEHEWSLKKRLNLIEKIAAGMVDKRYFTIPKAARKALIDISDIATQPAAELAAQAQKILSREYTNFGILSFLKAGQQRFIMSTTHPLQLIDGSELQLERAVWCSLVPGTHKFERIQNPWPRTDSDFLVLRGTQIGLAESYLEHLSEEQFNGQQITFTEDTEA